MGPERPPDFHPPPPVQRRGLPRIPPPGPPRIINPSNPVEDAVILIVLVVLGAAFIALLIWLGITSSYIK